MKKVIVASTNPVKIDAARVAFTAMFPDQPFDIQGVKVESGVAEQPMSSLETKTGTLNRVSNAKKAVAGADYWIAFEGGVEDLDGEMTSVIWVAIQDKNDHRSATRCTTFVLPPKIADLVRGGMTLGDADDLVFKRQNSKQQNGAIGLLTHDVRTRTSVYTEGAIMALIPFKNPELYGL